MQATPPYDDILEDETLAPLKRNHACLQCKRRKVKCDGVRPTCNPCLRSHAHALRSAQRNKSRSPALVCTYADNDDVILEAEPERKRVSLGSASTSAAKLKKQAVGGGERNFQREKERRGAEERDTLKARIAELEARLADLSTNEIIPNGSLNRSKSESPENIPMIDTKVLNGNAAWTIPMQAFPASLAGFDSQPSTAAPILSIEAGEPGLFQSFDFSNLLMLPNNWPRNLPSPAILEHLIETFFQSEPQLPRMIHRATLLSRIRLAPNHPDFPAPELLHAICAAAAPHTACVNTLNPLDIDDIRRAHIESGMDLETASDFATAQCEAAERCIRYKTLVSGMLHGQPLFDVVRAHIILSQIYLNAGLALRGWMTGALAGRIIKALEISTRNLRKADKPPLMDAPESDREREERVATVWIAYILEASFASNACWASSLTLDEIFIRLPTSSNEWNQRVDQTGYMKENPQTAHDPNVLVYHPVPDPFVLVVKSSLLLGRIASWVYDWNQRVVQPGDAYEGMKLPAFLKLVNDIDAFQSHLPPELKNVYRLIDSGNMGQFTADLLSVHVFPNLALMLLHEPFMEWGNEEGPNMGAIAAVQNAFERIMGIVHLVPSQLDITMLFTPMLAFSLFSVGRIVSKFACRASKSEQYALAMRWRADLISINGLLGRYAEKHALGIHLQVFIASHVKMHEEGRQDMMSMKEICLADVKGSIPSASASVKTPGTNSDTDMGTRSSEASVSGTATTSPSVPTSLGRTPESIDAMDAATYSSGSASTTHLTPDYLQPQNMQQTLGRQDGGGYDPSVFEFFDQTAAAQAQAAMCDMTTKMPDGPQSPLSELLAGLNANNMGPGGTPNGFVNLMGDIPGWNYNQFAN
ncbi:hypothetical protein CcaverHIS002_0202900 [Cutaneotrichosporon cavernicola]|uniref:Zn(2)-C6 fungal-type domain-containing protein n=1 Tax=Cutaneotrichosporon cavernicola TaxID=279322 RepID=A0AA48I0F4_9TREE|nr:uncharacterized protein CcaverHIS019_0202910 [Cutaneotrichosporon cavernicola]BEI81130.1 hypothetical protein CcaverHIS002_0202900 [Cutaneotrichosporon cavernicola]BEI88929.1 hypothetical protein CcaverHIS019_0202910 [Cutaneotrichosporon cavernicola]BEI96706.1 hypothetical protein CcaverHIS631_0202950 [Cutaneotrichosporon cavernicola]BEJ04478.1 hypothetical protein CcaverHIS641_0202950 [Cutaneotrichosporon cavernicola]